MHQEACDEEGALGAAVVARIMEVCKSLRSVGADYVGAFKGVETKLMGVSRTWSCEDSGKSFLLHDGGLMSTTQENLNKRLRWFTRALSWSSKPTSHAIEQICCPAFLNYATEEFTAVNGPSLMPLIHGHGHGIRKLDLSRGSVDDNMLEALGTLCPCLREVYLERCASISDKGLVHIAKHSLVRLSLAHCKGVTEAGLIALAQICPSLQVFICSRHATWFQEWMGGDGAMHVFAQCLKQLRELDISNWKACNVEHLQTLFQNCDELHTLGVAGCELQDGADLQLSITGCLPARVTLVL